MKNLVLQNSVVVVSMMIGQVAAAQDETKEVVVTISPAAVPKAELISNLFYSF